MMRIDKSLTWYRWMKTHVSLTHENVTSTHNAKYQKFRPSRLGQTHRGLFVSKLPSIGVRVPFSSFSVIGFFKRRRFHRITIKSIAMC